ncbi:hypothetical protein CN918_29145 [Priestia megaterium]|nr:hypothetical protein CN918_29145 [Priestia megaterium]
MISILLEVKNSLKGDDTFYTPSPKEFKKFPRTENGLSKAVKELGKVALKYDWIQDYRFVVYEGKYEYYKNMSPKFIVNADGSKIDKILILE